METLKINNLAAYLPYGLKMAFIIRNEIVKIGVLNNISINNSDIHPIRYSIDTLNDLEHEWMFKPILIPLSDLNKSICINEEKINVKEVYFSNSDYEKLINPNLCIFNDFKNEFSYNKINILLKYHFDIFGLIEKNLAIDINTL